MGSRTWIKVYCDKWLAGTLRDETPELRGVWIDLLALAGSGKYGDTGEVKLADNIGLKDEQIAGILSMTLRFWLKNKEKLIETGRISVNQNNIIHIINWAKYQSEYTRQRLFRDNKKLQPEVTTERDTEKEKEKEIKENKEKENQALGKSPDPLSESRKLVFEGLQERRGNKSPVPGAEAKAITWMLKEGYTVEQILSAYDTLKRDSFWTNQFLSMQSVKKQIGEVFQKKEGAGKPLIEDTIPGLRIIESGTPPKPKTSEVPRLKVVE